MVEVLPPLFSSLNEGLIRRVQKARRVRTSFFSEDLFADPAWDILLELYACELGQQRISISKAVAAAGVPGTTGLRWIDKLTQENLIGRQADPLDARRVWIALTPKGTSSMHRYFAATSVTALPL